MTQENTALLEALANIQEELALTLEELIDHNGDSMDDARRKRIDQLRARHWSDCAVYNEPHAPSGPCDCGGYLVSITTPTTDSLTADAAAVREAAAKALGLYRIPGGKDALNPPTRWPADKNDTLPDRDGTVPLTWDFAEQCRRYVDVVMSALPLPTQTVPADVAALDGIRHSIIRQLGDDPHADRIILNRTDWDLVLSALSSAALAQPKGGDQE